MDIGYLFVTNRQGRSHSLFDLSPGSVTDSLLFVLVCKLEQLKCGTCFGVMNL